MKNNTEKTRATSSRWVYRNAETGELKSVTSESQLDFSRDTSTPPTNGKNTDNPNEVSKFEAKTLLGRELMKIRRQIVASGETLLEWDEINQEVARRRGEIE